MIGREILLHWMVLALLAALGSGCGITKVNARNFDVAVLADGRPVHVVLLEELIRTRDTPDVHNGYGREVAKGMIRQSSDGRIALRSPD